MLERRQQTRFHPGATLQATLLPDPAAVMENGHTELRGRVEDVSSRGFKVQLPEALCRGLKQGQSIKGELHTEGGSRSWSGNITHLNPRSGGISVGIALETRYDDPAPLRETVELVIQDPKTGGISLRRQGDKLQLDVIGHLSLPLSRDFLHLVRGGSLAAIDLNQCKGMDSAGLGMLCIAADARIPLINAHGVVKDLLEVARIPLNQDQPRHPASTNPIRVSSPAKPRERNISSVSPALKQ